jgi:hypothetical protein
MAMVSFPLGLFGIILATLVLCCCLIWLIFPFVAMSRLRGIRREIEKNNQYLANFSSEQAPSSPQPTVRVVPTARVVPTIGGTPSVKTVPPGIVMPPPSVVPLKISKGGKEHSLKDTASIKIMLKTGELTLQDRYYDRKRREWVPLDHHPEISR